MKDKVKKLGLEDMFEIASAATSSEEIWNGEKMRALRRKHISGNIYETICGGHYDCKSNANLSM